MLKPNAEELLGNVVRMAQLRLSTALTAHEARPSEATESEANEAARFAGFAEGVFVSLVDRDGGYPAVVAVSRVSWRYRWLLFVTGLLTLLSGRHHYFSTGCLHGDHGYCRGEVGKAGAKVPGRCKFCPASCRCSCHSSEG